MGGAFQTLCSLEKTVVTGMSAENLPEAALESEPGRKVCKEKIK